MRLLALLMSLIYLEYKREIGEHENSEKVCRTEYGDRVSFVSAVLASDTLTRINHPSIGYIFQQRACRAKVGIRRLQGHCLATSPSRSVQIRV